MGVYISLLVIIVPHRVKGVAMAGGRMPRFYCAWLLVRRKILRLYLGYLREVARCLHVWDGAGEGGSAEER